MFYSDQGNNAELNQHIEWFAAPLLNINSTIQQFFSFYRNKKKANKISLYRSSETWKFVFAFVLLKYRIK